MNPTWLAKQFVKELIRQPDLKCRDMQEIIEKRLKCKVSWSKFYRSRCMDMSKIEGKLSDNYGRIWE